MSLKIADIYDLNNINIVPKVYIQDNNQSWVDFSDYMENGGVNLLQQLSSIRYSSEVKHGTYGIQFPGIMVNLLNENNYFNQPFPSTLLTIAGVTASFSDTKRSKFSVLSNKKGRILVQLQYNDMTFLEYVVATYLIYGSKTITNTNFDIRFESLINPLRNSDSAERVINGLDWYRNRPSTFLISELLKLRYVDTDSLVVPSTYLIPDKVQIPTAAFTAGDAGEQRGFSNYGRLPEKDSNGVWLNKGYIVRAMLFSFPPSSLSAQWDGVSAPPAGNRDTLYYGADNVFYKWDPDTEISTEIGSVTSGYNIRKIYESKLSANTDIYIVAWQDAPHTDRRHNMKIYKHTGSGGITLVKTITDATNLGDIYRTGDDQGLFWRVSGVLGGGFDDASENAVIPFRQYVKFGNANNSKSYLTERDGLSVSTTANVSYEAYIYEPFANLVNLGYYTAGGFNNASDPLNQNFKYTMGQNAFMIAVPEYGTIGGLVYSAYDNTNDEFDIVVIDGATGVVTVVDAATVLGGEDCQALTGCVKTDENKIFVAGIFFDEANDLNVAETYIGEYDLSSLPDGATTVYDSTADSNSVYLTPLEMVYTNSKLYLSIFDRNLLNKHNAYRVVSHPGTSQDSFDNLPANFFANQPMSFIVGSDSDFYFVTANDLSGYMVDVSASDIIRLKKGLAVVDDDIWNRAIAIDTATRSTDIVYGSSSMIPGEWTNSDEDEGKYYLWKFDVYLTDRIEYADFTGLDVWRAVQLIGQVIDYDFGFTQKGDFFLFAKPDGTETADLTLNDDVEGEIKSLGITIDEKAVYNNIKVTPYSALLQDPRWRFTQQPRTDIGAKDFNSDIFIQQRDTQKRLIRMKCMTSGKLSEHDIHFKYFIYDEEVETVLSATHTAGGATISVNIDVDAFVDGDEIEVKSSTNTETITINGDPSVAQIQDRQIPITALSNNYTIGDRVKITKVSSGWSGKGQKNIEDDPYLETFAGGDWSFSTSETNIDSSQDTNEYLFSRQSMKLIGSGASPSLKRQYPATSLKVSQKYTALVAVKPFIGDNNNARTAVTINVAGATQAVTGWTDDTTTGTDKWQWLRGTFTTNAASSALDLFINLDENLGVAWIGGIFLLEGEHQEVDVISIGVDDVFVPIGRTNIWLKFKAQSTESSFKEGDILEINCPGMKLEAREYYRSPYTDMDSVNRYGLNPYPPFDNRFVSTRYAPDIARKIGSLVPNPPMYLDVKTPLDLRILPVNEDQERLFIINVKSRKNLVTSPDYTEKCKVLEVIHDFKRKETNVRAVSFNPV